MPLRLYNTLSAIIEECQPLQNGEVRMYAFGPTVYDYGHIGNFRTFLAVDILRRFLRQSGYKIQHVMNISAAKLLMPFASVVTSILRSDDDKTVRDKIIEAVLHPWREF